MNYDAQLLLIGAVATVGVLHTIVPDHWVPITLIARQRGWTKAETFRASIKAGTGHVLSTLAIALVVWLAGVAFAQRFGNYVDTASSIALIGFGGWIAISSLIEMHGDGNHDKNHGHSHGHVHSHQSASGNHAHDYGTLLHGHHDHEHVQHGSSRTALLLILGSSPMIEGIPAFFAAGKYGIGLIAIMSLVFAFTTIATY